MTATQTSVDLIVVGSGAGGLTTAIAAADRGHTVLVLESSDRWGGSSSMSGGGLWLPNNPLMQREGVHDSREDALTYLEETIGDAGPATSRARKEAFVDNIAPFVQLCERHGMKWARSTNYPDYYPELPGGRIGRALEVEPYDRRKIGTWWDSSRGQDGVPLPMMTNDFWLMARAWSTPGGFARAARVVGRTVGTTVTGKKAIAMGPALMASMLEVALRLGVELRLNSPVDELLVDGDGVTGVIVNGQEIRANAAVMLASGGFDHNDEWRQKYQGIDGRDSSGSHSNKGSATAAAMAIGAAVDLMDDAWWGGSIPGPAPDGKPSFLVSERSMPFSIIVDEEGNRFANESESYVDLGHHMRSHPVKGAFWMIADVRHARRYLRSYALDPKGMKAMTEQGIAAKADTLAELAATIGVNAEGLRKTIARFNGFARAGMDEDFKRGSSAYDRYYGDPLVQPNPNLGPLEKGPFTAFRIVAGDLGTKGGILTDERARALREDGSVIPGLYATGNASASVMGHTYPGPGSTIGPAAVFGYIAARDVAGA